MSMQCMFDWELSSILDLFLLHTDDDDGDDDDDPSQILYVLWEWQLR